MEDTYLGFDIGGTKCAVLLGKRTPEGFQTLHRTVYPTAEAPLPEQMLPQLLSAAREMCPKMDARALGISCGGPLDSRRGLIQSPPNLPGWDDVPIVRQVEEALGLPAFLQNDANAGALAEWRYGGGRGCENMIFLTFGTGCGAGLILDGRLYAGTNDMAGECGHIRLSRLGPVGYGKAGAMEGFCSGTGIAQLATLYALEDFQNGRQSPLCQAYRRGTPITAALAAGLARQGDPTASRVFATAGTYLGQSLAMLTDLLNPEKIVLGSVFVRCQDLLWPPARQVLEQEALPRSLACCQVVPAELGERIGDLAALCVAEHGAAHSL